MADTIYSALYGASCEDGAHEWGDWQQSRMAGTWHRPCLHCRYITLDGPEGDETGGDN